MIVGERASRYAPAELYLVIVIIRNDEKTVFTITAKTKPFCQTLIGIMNKVILPVTPKRVLWGMRVG